MSAYESIEVAIRLWSEGDLPLLERLMGDPAMTEHLGGPETPQKIRERHARYCRNSLSGKDLMFVILLGPERAAAGSVGYWEREWQGQTVWETGWFVLPEHQGRGIATRATALVVERARAEEKHRFMHAFPAVDNHASNAICRKVGFTLQGEVDFEYPPGHSMRCNDWRLDLSGSAAIRHHARQGDLAHGAHGSHSRTGFMSEEHHKVRDFVVLEIPRRGRPLPAEEIAREVDLPLQRVQDILDELEKRMTFLFRNESGAIAWAYPVTAEPTPHRIRFSSGEQIYAA